MVHLPAVSNQTRIIQKSKAGLAQPWIPEIDLLVQKSAKKVMQPGLQIKLMAVVGVFSI